MVPVKAEAMDGLVAAAAREAEAAGALTDALRTLRAAMEVLDPPAMEGAVAQARHRMDTLALAANSAASLTRLAARAVGLSEGASLSAVGDRMGPVEGAKLRASVSSLHRRLEDLGVEAAAQVLAASHCAGLWSHLIGLRGENGNYGSRGQMRPGPKGLGSRV